MSTQAPLVSVIVPVYNAAKYIQQTLESLLYQTLKDFEVVIADDCSTDNSIEVVESFIPKFNSSNKIDAFDSQLEDSFLLYSNSGEFEVISAESFSLGNDLEFLEDVAQKNDSQEQGIRLNIIKMPEHTGTPGLPRNVGIKEAHGKYIAFLDSDDFFTETALEELSTLAEEYQADVIHMDSWFILWNGKKKSVDDPKFFDVDKLPKTEDCIIRQPSENVPTLTEPTFDADNLAERLDRWLDWNYNWATYLTFARRDFLIANQIFFPNLKTVGDMIFMFECLCLAKKFLRVPNITNIIRPRAGSISREYNKKLNLEDFFHKRVSSLREGFVAFEKFMDRLPFFRENPAYRYAVKDFFFKRSMTYGAWHLNRIYKKNETFILNELIRKEFHQNDAALASYLFDTINFYRIRIEDLEEELAKFQKQ